MMLKRTVVAVIALFAFGEIADAQYHEELLSNVSIYGGGNFLRFHQGDGYDYYDDRESDTYSGVMEGAQLRLVAPIGLMFDASVENARASRDSYAYKEQQVLAGIGYIQRVGRGANWSVEAFYERYRVGLDGGGCDFSCNGWYTANGGGVKAGFTWPFAQNWFGAANVSAAYLSFPSNDGWQARLDASVGYLLTPNTSISVGVASQVTGQTDRNYDDYYGYYYDRTTSIDRYNVFAKVGFHF